MFRVEQPLTSRGGGPILRSMSNPDDLLVKRRQIVWSGRYGDEPHDFCVVPGDESTRITAPIRVSTVGTLMQARWLAAALSNQWPGEDYCYVVESDDEEVRPTEPAHQEAIRREMDLIYEIIGQGPEPR